MSWLVELKERCPWIGGGLLLLEVYLVYLLVGLNQETRFPASRH